MGPTGWCSLPPAMNEIACFSTAPVAMGCFNGKSVMWLYPLNIARAPHCLSYKIISTAGPRKVPHLPLTSSYSGKRFWRTQCHSHLWFLVLLHRAPLFLLFSGLFLWRLSCFFTCKTWHHRKGLLRYFSVWKFSPLVRKNSTRYKKLNLYVIFYLV